MMNGFSRNLLANDVRMVHLLHLMWKKGYHLLDGSSVFSLPSAWRECKRVEILICLIKLGAEPDTTGYTLSLIKLESDRKKLASLGFE